MRRDREEIIDKGLVQPASDMGVEAVVSFVAGKLGDLLIEEGALFPDGVRDQIGLIERGLRRMQVFLEDADTKQKNDGNIKNWVVQFRDISYDAEDVIDTFISKVARERRPGFVGLLKRDTCIFNELINRRKFGKEIERIRVRMNDISYSRPTHGISDISDGRPETTSTNQNLHDRRRNFAEILQDPDVVGFEEDRKTLKEQLINGDSRRAVISILGMGGSGKTTLAKKVYHDVEEHFDCCAFIYLSQQYKIRDILMRIIKRLTRISQTEKLEMEEADEQDLRKKLSDHLIEKRYLIVIDDIWTKEAWDALNPVLPDGLNKSRVMLTTRIREVALHADPLSHPHEIRLLDDRESWELFIKKVFPQGSSCPLELEETGRQMLVKCGCLPLAIIALGGLLSMRDKTRIEWNEVLESVILHLATSAHHCMEILALSYYELPHYLKPCFLYLSLFPEDFEIKSKRLIRLWIAEGFIAQRGNDILEDVAEDYLEELIGRSMLQVVRKRCDGSVSTCHVHVLLRELSISVAKQSKFFEIIRDVNTGSSLTSKCRRLVFYHHASKDDKVIYHSTLRSILSFQSFDLDLSNLFSKHSTLLRVLDVESGRIPRMGIPQEMRELVHLRYLNLGREVFEAHPKCFTFLHRLQTLKLKSKYGMVLPNAIWDLKRLRHLHACCCEIEGQPRLDNLGHLQTLCLNAGSWIENGLDKLTGLRILGINGHIGLYSNALSYSIEKLDNLRSLKIADNGSIIPFMSIMQHLHLYKMHLDGPIEKLPDLPPNVKKLTLLGSQLQQDDITKLEKLQHLQILGLWHNWNSSKKWICSSEGFSRLEFLDVDGIYLTEWIVKEVAMPCLRSIELLNKEHVMIDLPKRLYNLLT